MNWLFLPPLRLPLGIAALASLLLNVALLVPSLYMMALFDRVFASRSVETLAMLTLLAALALLLGWAMDRARTVALAHAGARLDEQLAEPALHDVLTRTARGAAATDGPTLRDLAALRSFLGGPAMQALFDAPWLPLHLGVIALLHPVLGLAAAGSALAVWGAGRIGERLAQAPAGLAADSAQAAAAAVDALGRAAPQLWACGQLPAAVADALARHAAARMAWTVLAGRQAALTAGVRALRQALQVVLLALGAWLVVAEQASPGIMVAATILLARALQPVEQLSAGWKSLCEARAAGRRLQPLCADARPAPSDGPMPALQGALVVQGLTVGLPGRERPLLHAVTLGVAAGGCLGITGPAGGGKSVLLATLLGLHRPGSGTLQLDGIDLVRRPLAGRGAAVGWLPSQPQWLPGSIAHNVAWGGPVDAQALATALRLAGLERPIAGLPQGPDTPLGADGAPLSTGQLRQLALARALYGLPRLVLLDDADAGLDRDAERALLRALQALRQAGSTVVLVAQRPALLRAADHIAVLHEGRVRSFGPRDQVLAATPVHAVRAPVAVPQGEAA